MINCSHSANEMSKVFKIQTALFSLLTIAKFIGDYPVSILMTAHIFAK